jgi:enoyl-CoA hydratase/carnithine racemase
MSNILVRDEGAVRVITMNRPDKKNALTQEMYHSIAGTLDRTADDKAVRCIIIAGLPGAFTAGNDLADFMRTAQGGGRINAALDFLRTLATFEKPIIASVSGVAIGIGTTLLLHCDLIYASPSARFKTPFVDLALVPEAGSSVLLPALVGARRAAQLLLLGEQLDAPSALAWGLINGVVDDPDAAAVAAATKLAACAPTSLRATKALTRRATRDAVLEQMRIEGEAFAERLRSPEALEALEAFMARRPADFSRF